MANFNRQADNRKAKLKRRRREVNRTIAQWEADSRNAQKPGDRPPDLTRKIRTLKKEMRYQG